MSEKRQDVVLLPLEWEGDELSEVEQERLSRALDRIFDPLYEEDKEDATY